MPNCRLSREQSRWSSVVPERSPGNSRQTALATALELAAGRGRSFQAIGEARQRRPCATARVSSCMERDSEPVAAAFRGCRSEAGPILRRRTRGPGGSARPAGASMARCPRAVDAEAIRRRALALEGARARARDQRKACRLPQWATLRPIFAASVSANRKWMPDQMRASTMSSRSCEKLVNCRVRPLGVVPLNVASSRP
jgi:hypothetical protein